MKTEEAKKLALAWLNEQRQASNKPLLKSVPKLWWTLYGKEWMSK